MKLWNNSRIIGSFCFVFERTNSPNKKNDIRDLAIAARKTLSRLDTVVIDVSFISLREILPSVAKLCNSKTEIYAMVTPQFEAVNSDLKHKGVIKNDTIRRNILKD